MNRNPIFAAILLLAASHPAFGQSTDATAETNAAETTEETAAEAPAPRDALLTLVNNAGAMVMHFHVTPVVTATEGSDPAPAQAESGDLLAGGVISPGSTAIIKIPAGEDICTFDLRFDLRDGQTLTGSADICASDVFVIQ